MFFRNYLKFSIRFAHDFRGFFNLYNFQNALVLYNSFGEKERVGRLPNGDWRPPNDNSLPRGEVGRKTTQWGSATRLGHGNHEERYDLSENYP